MVPFLRPNFLAGSSLTSPTGGRGPAKLFSAGAEGIILEGVGPLSDVSGQETPQASSHLSVILGQQRSRDYDVSMH